MKKKIAVFALLILSTTLFSQTKVLKSYTLNSGETDTFTIPPGLLIKPDTWIKSGSTFLAGGSPSQSIPGPDFSENYYLTIQFQKPVNSLSEITSEDDVIKSIAYFDGLGRAKQSIAIRAGGNSEDIVTHIGYDQLGRQELSYLPYPASSDLGSYKNSVELSTRNYYKTKFADDFTGIDASNINPYSKTQFESSPLNRVIKQAAPGEDWKLGNGNEMEYGYDVNSTNEVRNFRVEFINGETDNPNLILASSNNGYYSTGELFKTVVRNENHNGVSTKDHSVEEFKDKLGRTILTRTYNNEVAHDTYYVYDDYGNLTYMLSPKSEPHNGVPNSTDLAELCYQYKYGIKNRLIEKKIPGKGWEYIVYDNLDRPILTQDSNLKASNTWLFTKHDVFGRVIYSGKYIDASDRSILQSTLNGKSDSDLFEEKVNSGTGFENTYYTNNDFPKTNVEILTINYYDDYSFNHSATNPGTVYGKVVSLETNGEAVGSKVKVLDNGNNWTTSVSYFDDMARPIYVHSKNDYLNTIDVVKNNIDFVGKIIETTTEHEIVKNDASVFTITTIDKFEYDHLARVKKQTQQIVGQPDEERIYENFYDELGQLGAKEVGNVIGNSALQKVDYKYNVRGWLKSINNETGSNGTIGLGATDLFGFQINYNNPTDINKKQLDGNISQTLWKTISVNTTGNPISNQYTYDYDGLNRLTEAVDNTSNYNVGGIAYDKNGNISHLNREGLSGNFGQIDNLSYRYSGNKLLKVDDSANSAGFNDGNTSGNDFTYDSNGNFISDANKEVENITYNFLNLPTIIAFPHQQNNPPNAKFDKIEYVYDANGVKLEKKVSTAGFYGYTENYTIYTGNHIYTKIFTPDGLPGGGPYGLFPEELQYFAHAEGYVTSNILGNNEYVYQYADHLGNVRLSYSDTNADGSIAQNEIIEESNYYPFGLKHMGYNNVVGSGGNSIAQKFKFQGQEFEEYLGINNYEFDLRLYDASLGRWFNSDPYEQFNSPYIAMGNNPVVAIDPDGGYCFNAQGEQIVCPDDEYFDDVRNSETNHHNQLDEVVVKADSREDSNLNKGNSPLDPFGLKGLQVLEKKNTLLGKIIATAEPRSVEILGQFYSVDVNGQITHIAPQGGLGVAGLIGPGGSLKLLKFRGLIQNLPLRTLTHHQLVKAFKGTGIKLSGHAIKRLKDVNIHNLGVKTLNDVKAILKKGRQFDAGKGDIGFSLGRVEVIVTKQNVIRTVRAVKNKR